MLRKNDSKWGLMCPNVSGTGSPGLKSPKTVVVVSCVGKLILLHIQRVSVIQSMCGTSYKYRQKSKMPLPPWNEIQHINKN